MKKVQTDLSIFKEFEFERKPVGVKFLLGKPEGINQLDKKLALCEMFKEAQEKGPFYAAQENFECMVGPLILGMKDPDPIFESGQVGPKLGVYDDARANRRVYQQISTLSKDSVKYVAFAPFDALSFNPDILIVVATIKQTEIILRAASYTSGKMWQSKGTGVIGCSWMYIHPYLSGELNLMITGLYHGMIARQVFPEGLFLLSIPHDLLQCVTTNLQQMVFDLPQYTQGKEAHIKRMKKIAEDLSQELRD
ncbi:MAG: DUF169 domain-containing protein [Firmicutes bacterium]|nr:DUF169 domain-containing protein [Bacillota bacterium]